MNPEAAGRAAAEQFRNDHHLGDQPLGDLVALIEQTTGIDVAVLDVTNPGEHGMTMRDPDRGAVFIAIASTGNPMRQRSSLAHELAHVVFADWADSHDEQWDARSPGEIRADVFARHLLVPQGGLKLFVKGLTPSEATLSAVVQHFIASPSIVSIAMRQARFISEAQKLAWVQLTAPRLAARFGWSDQYRGLQIESNQRRAPQRLYARAIAGYEENVVSLQALATLRRCPANEVAAELKDAGIEPRSAQPTWASASFLPRLDVDLSGLEEVDEASEG
jgi:Zn-dependent peptidase ImmA (M78 family)